MAVSPSDLLQIGRVLIRQDGEINHRTAANRAYYAAFHYCKTMADSLPRVPVQGRGSHERLINRLKDHQIIEASRAKDVKIRTLGNFLDRGKALRVLADYRIDEEFNSLKAEELILMASKIADIVREIARD